MYCHARADTTEVVNFQSRKVCKTQPPLHPIQHGSTNIVFWFEWWKGKEKLREKRQKIKIKLKDKKLSMEERFKLQLKLNDLPRSSSRVRHRNRCQLTGRSRGVYRKFGLSRIKIRELSLEGKLPGVTKSSW